MEYHANNVIDSDKYYDSDMLEVTVSTYEILTDGQGNFVINCDEQGEEGLVIFKRSGKYF